MKGRKILSVMLLCALMLSLFLIISEEAEASVDFIVIVDTPGSGAVEIPDQVVNVGHYITGYAASFNNTMGYMGDIPVAWTVQNVAGATAQTNPSSGTNSTFWAGMTGGTAVWKADDGMGHTDIVTFTINPPAADFIQIVDTMGTGATSIPDQTVGLNTTITGYAAAFNNTIGYIWDISVTWSVVPTGSENAYTAPTTGSSSSFNSGTVDGNVWWIADDGMGLNDTVYFTITGGATVDYIKIVDTPGTGASEILDQSVNPWFEITGYAAAFNNIIGYLYDISVSWSVTNSNGSNASTSPSSGTSSTFHANDASGVATWKADDGAGNVDTVKFTIGSPVVDYILITDGQNGPEIPDQTINIGYYVTGRASAYNNTSGYIGTISVSWTVDNFDGATAYTNPPSGSGSTFNAGSTGGNATWTADDGSGHTDTVQFEITDYTVDYILIVDTEGTGSTEIPDQAVFPNFGINGYAAAFNSSSGYIADISVTWSVGNSGGSNASSTTNGTGSTFYSGDAYGTATWTADDGAGHTDSVVITIDPDTVDYILIKKGGSEIPDQTVNIGFKILGYASAYNNTYGYICDIAVTWSVANFDGATAYTTPLYGSSSTFKTNTTSGNATWTADDGYGSTDTVNFEIIEYPVDFIVIMDAPGGAGNEILDQTASFGFSIIGYAASYNNTSGYLGDITVWWSVSNQNGSNATTSPSYNSNSTFDAEYQAGIATWTANDGLGNTDTVVFTITSGPPPTVDYILIYSGSNGNGSEIPDQTVPVGITITGYAAAFNNSAGYLYDVSSDWYVIPSGGQDAYTTPPTGTTSDFYSGTIGGSVTWGVDDNVGHIDTVIFNIDIGPDYIQIVDTPGTGLTEIPDQTVGVGFSITGYAAEFNYTIGYLWDVSATWSVQNSGGASASTSPSYGVSSVFNAGSTGGTAIWTANYGGVTDTVIFTILPPTVDYVKIYDAPGGGNGSEIMDQTINVDTNITGYAVAFNNSIGYLYEISVFWSVANLDGASASTAPLTGIMSQFSAGSTNGNATWSIDDGLGHTDTVTFMIVGQVFSIDYISIRDAPGAGGNVVGDKTYCVWETDSFYAVAFNYSIGYLMDVEVAWESDDVTVGTVTTPGESTLFTAQWVVADDTCTVTASYISLTNTTGNLEVLSPRTDYVQIRDAPDGGGAVITSISYHKGDEDYFYGAAYNNTVDFTDNVPSSSAWDSSDPLIVEVSSPGSSTWVRCSLTKPGTVTVTLTVGMVHINTTIVVVLEWEVDYILIRDAPSGGGRNLCDPLNYPSYPVGHVTIFYGAMYNYTAGYIGNVSSNSNWTSDDTSIVEATSPGIYSTITCSDTNYGTVTIELEEWMGHSATTKVTVIKPTMDYVSIVDAPGGLGSEIGDMSYEIGDEDTYYSAAFNITAGYLFDVSVTWSSSDTTVGTVDPTTGSSTVFTAEGMGTCFVKGDYGSGISDTTGTLTVTLPSNITVDDSGGAHFTTIQEAINNAKDGDTVFVFSGTYHEHLFIDKSITLMGEDRFYAIIDGDGYGKVIFVTGDNVTITGFTIQDGEYGIYCQETDTTKIEYNIIKDYDYGIYCNMTTEGYVAYNEITQGQYGIVTFEAYNDAIRYNEISYNTKYGAKDYNSQLKNCFNWNYFHHNNIAYYYDPDTPLEPIEFDGNILENNDVGIKVENADTITITNNTLDGNRYGIQLLNASPNIADNSIVTSDYGIYGEYSSPTISNNVISDIMEHGIFAIYGDSLKIINNTMLGTDMILIDSTVVELWAEDTSIKKVNTTVEDAHLDEKTILEIQWSLRVRITDEEGQPIEDAVVLIYDVFDNLVSVQNTDSQGWIEAVDVTEKEEGASTTIIHNPYRVQVIKDNVEDTQSITVEGDTEHVIPLQMGAVETADTAFPWFLAFFLVIGAFVAIGLGGIAFEVIKYGLLVFFLPLYSRIKKREMLEQPIRHRIHGYIIGNPGAHYGLIKQELGIPNGQLVYHLNQLTKAHLIYSREDGIRKRFYPVALPVPKSGKIHLTKVQKEIMGVVEESSGANQKEIASSTGVSRQVAGYHLTKMEEKGYVRKELEGRETRYYPLENADC